MYINLIDNIIELACRKVEMNIDEEHCIQLHFEGENELDYFLVQRIYDFGNDEDNCVSVFYTEGCDTVGTWTYIAAILECNYVQFSVAKLPIRIHLPKLTKKEYEDLRRTLESALKHLGSFTENGGR